MLYESRSKTAVKMFAGALGAAGFILMALFLVYHYVKTWPPHALLDGGLFHNAQSRSSGSCCAQLFDYADEHQQSVSQAKAATYCSKNVLYSIDTSL